MSLFPAYSNETDPQESNQQVATSWISNSSFTASIENLKPNIVDHDESESSSDIELNQISNKSDDKSNNSTSDSEHTRRKKLKKGKKKRKKEKKSRDKREIKRDLFINEDLDFVLDTNRDLGYLNMTHQSKRARPRYEYSRQRLPGVFAAKKKFLASKKPLRYFAKKAVQLGQDDDAVGEQLKMSVELLNKAVYENPTDINNWLKLVNFQDDYFKFQPIQFKTLGERDRAVTSQKLAILERAMATSTNVEALQKQWLTLALSISTSDEIEGKLLELLRERGESLVLCIGRTMVTQYSMPRCTAPAVIKSYKESMERLQRSRHLSSSMQDNATLELFFHACTFLEQSGLWESAWTAIKLTLHLNFSLDVPDVSSSEKTVLDEENNILDGSKGVPIWHLWTRLETLRQGHHFLPVKFSENYPQRVVASDEIIELVHHVRRAAHFRLLIFLLLLAHVPFLPRSHSLLAAMLSQLTPWVLDSVEWQLSAVFCQTPVLKVGSEFLTHHLPLSQPPQYLRQLEGQREFLELASKLFEMVLSNVSGRQRVAVGVWYLRFLRWLDQLARLQRFHPPPGRPKTKTLFKEFLKKEENRDILPFFVEYALWEHESGDTASCVKTLETLVASKGAVLDQSDDAAKADLCALYRTLCDVQVITGQLDNAKTTLRRLCRSASDAVACSKLKHVALEAVHSEVAEELEDLMLPNFVVDWVSCYAMFLSLTDSIQESLNFLNEAIGLSSTSYIRERLYETVIAIWRTFANKKPYSEMPCVIQVLFEFPLNAVATTMLAETLTNGGGLWWKDLAHLLREPAAMGATVAVCAAMERHRRNDEVNNQRCRSLLARLTTTGRTSSLVHRMNLSVLAAAGDVENLDKARTLALEAFPWNKSLYMDAISTCPQQLMPLVDILVEKDLRIHITPDEIEALRD